MNWLNFYTKVYGKLHNYPGVPYWVLTPMRKIVRYFANKKLPQHLAKKHIDKEKGKKIDVIVSFTSFPARINDVWKVVESIKNQSFRPEKIILWLSEEQFPSKETIPDSLWKEEDELFEIRMVVGDIRSHKKFFYVMQEYPDKTFVTCDDDVYYHPDTLKYLVEGSKKYPSSIIANITHEIMYDDEGNLMSYNQWKGSNTPFSTSNLVQIGIGGVLYPPGSLHELTLRKELFINLTPLADDIWLNCMARLNSTPIVKSGMKLQLLPIESDSPNLYTSNKGENKNDIQISQLRVFLISNGYKDVYSINYQLDEVVVGGVKLL